MTVTRSSRPAGFPWARGAASLLPGFTVVIALLAISPTRARGQAKPEGEKLYEQRRYQEAYEAFRRELERDERSPAIEYNAGNALYRLGRVAEAIASFQHALQGSGNVRERSLYNMGNAYARQAEKREYKYDDLRSAARAYEDALVIDPSDADAKWNLELILRKLSLPGYGPRTMATRGGAQWRGGNLTKAGYPGTETGSGAATGGGFGSSQGESVRHMTESQARQIVQSARREAASSGVSQNEDLPRPAARGRPDW